MKLCVFTGYLGTWIMVRTYCCVNSLLTAEIIYLMANSGVLFSHRFVLLEQFFWCERLPFEAAHSFIASSTIHLTCQLENHGNRREETRCRIHQNTIYSFLLNQSDQGACKSQNDISTCQCTWKLLASFTDRLTNRTGVFNNLRELKELFRISPNFVQSQEYAKCFVDKTDNKIPAITLKSLVLMQVDNVNCNMHN